MVENEGVVGKAGFSKGFLVYLGMLKLRMGHLGSV